MGDNFYRNIRRIGSPFRYKRTGGDYLRLLGAALIVSNHQGAIGPIQCVLSLPKRLFPWVIADMVDPDKISDYLLKDFIYPILKIKGKIGKKVANALSKITLPLLQNIGCISVDRHDARFSGAFRNSLEILKQEEALLIFPEDPNTPMDVQSGMRSFMSGFLWLCPLYKKKTGKDLPVIPVAVCPRFRRIVVDDPVYYEDTGQSKQDMRELSRTLERRIGSLYSKVLRCQF